MADSGVPPLDARGEHDTGSDAKVLKDGSMSKDGEPDAKKDAKGEDAKASADSGDAGDEDASEPKTVSFSIDVKNGPARQYKAPTQPAAISPYIYGINASGSTGVAGDVTQRKTRWGLVVMGSNAFTDWNWTNNYLNLGDTACFWQGEGGGGGALAGAVTQSVDSISAAQGEGSAYLATVPIVDYVSAAVDNDTTASCPVQASDCSGGLASSTAVNTGSLAFASVDGGSPAFVPNVAHKPGGAFCTCPPSGCTGGSGCTVSTNPVYQDEFVNFISTTYSSGGAPVFFALDNEPNYWGFTHPEVWPYTGTLPCESPLDVTYEDIVSRDLTYATAIKAAAPTAKVFGPEVAQDGIVFAHSYSDPHLPTAFVDYYLAQMAAASSDAGTPLIDVLDVQYYNFANSPPAQCLQNPRMFWDPNYTELSAANTDQIDFSYQNGEFDDNWYPRELVPRLLRKIASAYGSASTVPQLSFSEYNSGCETVIAGAVAEADNLGIFGREDVFAAAFSSAVAPATNYSLAALDLYRNYDGNGAVVGDTAVRATTTNVEFTSVYAFAHSTDASAVDVVVLNKGAAPIAATLSIANAPALTTATVYDVVDGSPSVVAASGTAPAVACTGGICTLTYTMLGMSATVLILR